MDRPFDHLQSLEDFLVNDAFTAWVRGERPMDKPLWQDWLARFPEKTQLYETAVATVLTIGGAATPISDHQVQERIDSIRQKLSPEPARIVFISVFRSNWLGWAAAAAAAVLIGVIWWQTGRPLAATNQFAALEVQQRSIADHWQTTTNSKPSKLLVNLPDGSSVLLSPGSQIKYGAQTTDAPREVLLEGEGFFEVAKNPARPFFVYTKQLTTKVLGTSFRVRAFANEPTDVILVKTGKVMVLPHLSKTRKLDNANVALTMNEQLSLEKRTDRMIRKTIQAIPESSLSVVRMQQLHFEFAPVADVFTILSETYNTSIEFDRDKLRNCTFTGNLNDAPFLEKIRLICLATESTFDVVADNRIMIHSQGCR